MNVTWNLNRPKPGADTLVLLLHGMNCSPKTLSALTDRIRGVLPAVELLIPSMPLKWHKRLDLRDLSREICDYLAGVLKDRSFKSVILIGHSAGGVLVQAVYLDLRERQVPLGEASIRLVLIAPISRGWSISHHLPLLHKVAWLVGLKCAWFIQSWEQFASSICRRKARPLWVMQLQRGSPFTVGLRLRWLKYREGRPVIYVLLGSVDELVSWRDMVDEVLDDGSVQYREVPFSNHAEIVNIEDPDYGVKRADIILAALTEDQKQASPHADFEPWDAAPLPPEPDVERMVFVIHGIRDEGHWTQKIAARAQRLFKPEKSGGRIAVETSSYGYFSMLEFLCPAARQRKIHWLMDEYVEAKRRFPNAKFSYIGHSNGTFLVAQAMKDYPEVEFERIAFAGSVVASNFDWQSFLGKQVAHVLNFTATADWVVSFFPRMAEIFPPLQFLVGRNLGGAGVVPFPESQAVQSNTHVIGGHGAAIEEWNWDNLARFAVSSRAPEIPCEDPEKDKHYAPHTAWWCSRRGGPIVSSVVLFLLVGILAGLGCMAWMNPLMFWGLPLLILIAASCIVARYAAQAEGKTFTERKATLGRAGRWLGVAGVLVAVWFAAPWLLWFGDPSLLKVWQAFPRWIPDWLWPETLGAVRAFSLAGFLLGVWKVLTKV